jgi:hypothetical protein
MVCSDSSPVTFCTTASCVCVRIEEGGGSSGGSSHKQGRQKHMMMMAVVVGAGMGFGARNKRGEGGTWASNQAHATGPPAATCAPGFKAARSELVS